MNFHGLFFNVEQKANNDLFFEYFMYYSIGNILIKLHLFSRPTKVQVPRCQYLLVFTDNDTI